MEDIFYSRNSFFSKVLLTNFFYRSYLIFWIVMGCGIAGFGQRGLKTPQTQKNWSLGVFLGLGWVLWYLEGPVSEII